MINNKETLEMKRDIRENPEVKEILDKMSGEYSSTLRKLSHELGNILTLVNSSLQIIESSHPEVQSFKYWDTTLQDINYMKSLLTELTYFNNSTTLNLGPTNISSIVNGITQSFSLQESYRHIKFNFIAPSNAPNIIGDYVKIKQAVINIIKNACESIKDQGMITITLSFLFNTMTLTITDTGCGMTKEQQQSIFKPLITFKENGTGLGLSITSKIIEAHNGIIDVESEVNVGTSFKITLPI